TVKSDKNEYGAEFTGTESANNAIAARDVGGLLGYVRTGAMIKDCSAEKIYIESKGRINGCAGLYGDVWYTTNIPNNVVTEVANCSVSDVTIIGAGIIDVAGGFSGVSNFMNCSGCRAENVSITGGARMHSVGGFVGHTFHSEFGAAGEPCSVSGVKITGESDSAAFDNIGGFSGYVTLANFTSCSADKVDISAKGKALYVGGFVGAVAANSYDPASVSISSSTASGTIDLSATSSESRAIGGFLGSLWNEGYVNGKNASTVTLASCTATVTLSAVSSAGGFVGFAGADYASGATPNTVDANLVCRSCKANGAVYSAEGEAGGFVGFGYRGTFESCVSNCEVGGEYAGGFWGDLGANPNASVADDVTVTGCVAAPVLYGRSAAGAFFGRVNTSDGEAVTAVTISGYTTPDYFVVKASRDTEVTDGVDEDENITASGVVNGGYELVEPKENENTWVKKGRLIITVSRDGGELTATAASAASDPASSGSGSEAKRDVDPGAAIIYVPDGTLRKHILVEPVVTFNSNGGTPAADQHVPYGDTASEETSELAGYLFTGWSLNGEKYDFTDPVYDSITLDANWLPIPAPTEPEEPVQPEEPTEPEKPTEPEEPAQPEEPTEPEEPAQPEEPTEPEEPAQPEEPAETDIEDPDTPLDPIPDTGDHRLTWLWIVLAAVSAAGVVIAALMTRKKK
ncbi:MAG: InlB B-repeat-containing protein, partial [Oscillospiraceae bacterium]|nr:InlB B-repeat-containing protein [Oscillospiraceae bacterium]